VKSFAKLQGRMDKIKAELTADSKGAYYWIAEQCQQTSNAVGSGVDRIQGIVDKELTWDYSV
jgi:hypothetical protein